MNDLRHDWTLVPNTDGPSRYECACLISKPRPEDGFCPNKIEALRTALAPIVAIADAYDSSNLDEHRPEWETDLDARDFSDIELVSGRGGKVLLTLADVLAIRAALAGKPT